MQPFDKMFVTAVLLTAMIGFTASLTTAASPATQTNSGGGVTVKVTRLDSKAAGVLRFQIVLDTHSVNLDSYDLKTSIFLRDGSGNVYGPTTVDGKGSGHHREATISFSDLKKMPQAIELVIKGIAGIDQRVFRWKIE